MSYHKSVGKAFSYASNFSLTHIFYIIFSKSTAASTLVMSSFCKSFFAGNNKPEDMDPDLFVPIFDNPCFPKKVRTFFRFGVPESEKKIESEGKLIEIKENDFPASDLDGEMGMRTTIKYSRQ